MPTCTAPTHPTAPGPATDGHVVLGVQFTTGYDPSSWACFAPAPIGCDGTDWPPLTSMQRYAAAREAGECVPPSVSVWREQDRRRQAAAESEARAQRCGECGQPANREHRGSIQCACGATVAPNPVVAWGPGPACDDRKAAQ